MDKKVSLAPVISRNRQQFSKIKLVVCVAAIKATECECVILSLAISRLVNNAHPSDSIFLSISKELSLSARKIRRKGLQRKC